MVSKYLEEDSELITKLHDISKKSPKLIKSSTYPAPANPKITVRSWKMNEFKYYDIPSPFPTLARGIFTIEPDPDEQEGQDTIASLEKKRRIVARGYDKFFNIGEVPWCTWPALEQHTAAPYTLSLKSNGCIIFIAALTPTELLITSKHSIGPIAGLPVSHAEAGETWLRKYLTRKERTEKQLASCLWENNWTAISELCDDSFEEHVLGYPPEKTGLHLHGLNESTKEFKTLPYKQVDAFAEEWGFIKTPTITLNSISEVQSFTSKCGETGKWNGEPVEGFVVRTHVTEPPAGKGKSTTSLPYAPGSSFFFKVKFDEPYMMYRDWREVTKKLLTSKGLVSDAKLPKSKLKRAETKLYVKWVITEIKRDKTPFAEFTKGKGIIATRERFLKWMATEEGKKELLKAKAYQDDNVTVKDETEVFKKTIIVPVAIPGCGKTAVSVALSHIFGFGHTQSDDVHVKKPAPQFIKNVETLLRKHDVVIADKNNHLRQHRVSLRDLASRQDVPTRLLALNWAIAEKPQATIHRICGDRVTLRGDNHQTLRADSSAAKSHEEVIWMFINTTEKLTEGEVDATVDMDIEEGLEPTVRRAVDGVVRILDVEKPTEERILEAFDVVRGYKPSVKKPDERGKKGKGAGGARYYGLLTEIDLEEVLEKQLAQRDDADGPSKALDFFGPLKDSDRITKRPHVTLVHMNSLPGAQKLWDECVMLNRVARPPIFKARLGNLVWNGRVMAVTVDDLDVDGDESGAGKEFLQGLQEDLKRRLHVTVGTKDTTVQHVEARDMVEAWRVGKNASEIKSAALDGVTVYGRIKGLAQ